MYGNVSVVRYKKCGWLYIVRPSWINSRTTWSTSWEAAVWSCRRWYQPTSWPTWSKPTHASSPRSTCPTLTSTSRPTCALSASNPPHLLSGLIKSRLPFTDSLITWLRKSQCSALIEVSPIAVDAETTDDSYIISTSFNIKKKAQN